MRVGVIGNSHVAALSLGTPNGSEITYFAAPDATTDSLEISDGALVPSSNRLRSALVRSSGGQGAIQVSDFDAFAIVGLVDIPNVVAIGLTHRTIKHAAGARVSLISDACLKAAVHGAVRDSLATKTLAKLRAITESPVVVVPAPLPSSGVLDHPRHKRVWTMPELVSDTIALCQSALKEMGCPIVWQPSDTIEDGRFTKSEFTRGSVKLRQTAGGQLDHHPPGEYFHMNGAYGVIMLREMIDALECLRG